MMHAEKCDRVTYCGRKIVPTSRIEAGDVPPFQITTDKNHQELCSRCRKGLNPWPERGAATAPCPTCKGVGFIYDDEGEDLCPAYGCVKGRVPIKASAKHV